MPCSSLPTVRKTLDWGFKSWQVVRVHRDPGCLRFVPLCCCRYAEQSACGRSLHRKVNSLYRCRVDQCGRPGSRQTKRKIGASRDAMRIAAPDWEVHPAAYEEVAICQNRKMIKKFETIFEFKKSVQLSVKKLCNLHHPNTQFPHQSATPERSA